MKPSLDDASSLTLAHEPAQARNGAAMTVSNSSGSYRGHATSHDERFEIELRVDVEGPQPSRRISADIFERSADGPRYAGSLVLVAPRKAVGADATTFSGRATFTWHTATPRVEVHIPHVSAGAPSRATIRRYTDEHCAGPVYECKHESPFYRRVRLTEDVERGVDAVTAYEVPAPTDGGSARRLSIVEAYEDAGIELHTSGARTTIETTLSGSDAAWSDSELHAAMDSRLGSDDGPHWAVWMLHAHMHDQDLRPNNGVLYGVMFDQHDAIQRRGCAIFYRGLAGSAPNDRRHQLFTCAHELGHTFNLKHCWMPSDAGPTRPDALSWMNYPGRYPLGGEAAFWPAFQFGFDDSELAHVRHGFRDNVIMGSKRYRSETPSDVLESWPGARDDDETGLRLGVRAPSRLQFGVPLTVELQLTSTRVERQQVPSVLGPRTGSVDVFIRRRDGTTARFEPLLHHCREAAMVDLCATDAPLRDHAFLHYGRGGFAFDEPGAYELRAIYQAPDGRVVMSEAARVEVERPLSEADRAAASLLYGSDEQGILMSVVGSDARSLSRGDAGLQEFIDRYPQHPAASVARIARGTNAARVFKTIASDGTVTSSPCEPARARELLGPVLDMGRLSHVVDCAPDQATATRSVAVELERIGTKPTVSPIVDAFIHSRCAEIATELAGLS